MSIARVEAVCVTRMTPLVSHSMYHTGHPESGKSDHSVAFVPVVRPPRSLPSYLYFSPESGWLATMMRRCASFIRSSAAVSLRPRISAASLRFISGWKPPCAQ